MIDWGARGNPAGAMPDLGARLEDLSLAHPDPEGIAVLHAGLGLTDPPRIVPGPALRYAARIATPAGVRILF